MRCLLDTHVWLWSLLEPARLTPGVERELRSPEAELWLSPISVWETLVLAERRRVLLEPDPLRWIDEALARSPAREAPLTHAVARQSRGLGLPTNDPADRFIVATALVYDLTLVTADRAILRSGTVRTRWDRVREPRKHPRRGRG